MRIGCIGLGHIGRHLASNLLAAGYEALPAQPARTDDARDPAVAASRSLRPCRATDVTGADTGDRCV